MSGTRRAIHHTVRGWDPMALTGRGRRKPCPVSRAGVSYLGRRGVVPAAKDSVEIAFRTARMHPAGTTSRGARAPHGRATENPLAELPDDTVARTRGQSSRGKPPRTDRRGDQRHA